MKNPLILCLFLFVIVNSCAPEFVNDARILATGTLTDGNGNTLPNKQVNLYIRNFSGFIDDYQTQYLVGSGISNEDGSFDVVGLLAYDENFFIAINGDDEHVDYIYQTSIGNQLPSNLAFELGTVFLKRKATASFNITRASSPGTSISYSISYQIPYCFEVYEEGILVPEMSNCYTQDSISGLLNDDNPNGTASMNSTVGSMLTFTYSINGQPEVTETFTIDQPNFSYEFTY